jgi:hypothetical protein
MKNKKFPSGKTLKYYNTQFAKMKHSKAHYEKLHCEGYIWESYSCGVHTFHRTLSENPPPFTLNDQWIHAPMKCLVTVTSYLWWKTILSLKSHTKRKRTILGQRFRLMSVLKGGERMISRREAEILCLGRKLTKSEYREMRAFRMAYLYIPIIMTLLLFAVLEYLWWVL